MLRFLAATPDSKPVRSEAQSAMPLKLNGPLNAQGTLIGPAMYFGLMGDGQPLGRYDDMWAGWCSKVQLENPPV